MQALVSQDRETIVMPPIRINANLAMEKFRTKNQLEQFQRDRLKQVTTSEYLRRSPEQSQDPLKLVSGLFEPVSAHFKFNKDTSTVKSMYKSFFGERSRSINLSQTL